MRSFWVLVPLLLWCGFASAQEHHMNMTVADSGVLDCTDTDVDFGFYSYRHCTLHKSGTIDELLNLTHKNCCDGGTGGECRATSIHWNATGPVAFIDGMWCPVDAAMIRQDLTTMPADVEAVVCAAKTTSSGAHSCPSTYCAAMRPPNS
jgi:hypothetical protein